MQKTKTQISCMLNMLINAYVFTTQIVQYLLFLNQKFQACCHLVSLYISVCVRPGQKPQRQVFSLRSSINCSDLKFANKHESGFVKTKLYCSLVLQVCVCEDSCFLYSQTCVKRPYKTRHVFGFSERWLLIDA